LLHPVTYDSPDHLLMVLLARMVLPISGTKIADTVTVVRSAGILLKRTKYVLVMESKRVRFVFAFARSMDSLTSSVVELEIVSTNSPIARQGKPSPSWNSTWMCMFSGWLLPAGTPNLLNG